MAIGVIGQKAGMSRIFKEQGISVPCTIIRVIPNRISQVKTTDSDGYKALQVVGGENKKASHITRPMKGHFRKTSVQAGKEIREFRVADREMKKVGAQIGVEIFSEGQKVRVTGISKGKGFAGTIKRHNFHGQDNSHGNSLSHRVMGAVGQCQFPGRVFKGKKMPGQMGNARVTIKNLEIVKVDKERQLLWIKGAVPGSRNNTVLIRHLSDIDIQAVSPDTDPQQEQPQTEQPPTPTKTASAEQAAEQQPATETKLEPEASSSEAAPTPTKTASAEQAAEQQPATETKLEPEASSSEAAPTPTETTPAEQAAEQQPATETKLEPEASSSEAAPTPTPTKTTPAEQTAEQQPATETKLEPGASSSEAAPTAESEATDQATAKEAVADVKTDEQSPPKTADKDGT